MVSRRPSSVLNCNCLAAAKTGATIERNLMLLRSVMTLKTHVTLFAFEIVDWKLGDGHPRWMGRGAAKDVDCNRL